VGSQFVALGINLFYLFDNLTITAKRSKNFKFWHYLTTYRFIKQPMICYWLFLGLQRILVRITNTRWVKIKKPLRKVA